jgi:hypothetical protein
LEELLLLAAGLLAFTLIAPDRKLPLQLLQLNFSFSSGVRCNKEFLNHKNLTKNFNIKLTL